MIEAIAQGSQLPAPEHPVAAARKPWSTVVAALVSTVVSGSSLYGLYRGTMSQSTAIALLIGIAGVLALIAWLFRRPSATGHLLHLLLYCIAGPIGSLITLIGMLSSRPAEVPFEKFEDWQELPPGGSTTQADAIGQLADQIRDKRINGLDNQPILPLIDVIELADPPHKLASLRVVANQAGRDLGHVIESSLDSNDAAVRVLGSTIRSSLRSDE